VKLPHAVVIVLNAIVQSLAVGIMWMPYVPACSGLPPTLTSDENLIVVFSLAPARHGWL